MPDYIVPCEEDVARILFSPTHFKEGKISPTAFAFRSNIHEKDISMLRTKLNGYKDQLLKIINNRKTETYKGCIIFNVAELMNINDIPNTAIRIVSKSENTVHASMLIYYNNNLLTWNNNNERVLKAIRETLSEKAQSIGIRKL